MKSMVIRDFTADPKVKKNEKLTIQITGVFNDKGWKMHDIKAEVENNEITLDVIARKKSGMMYAQVLVPYTTSVQVKRLKKGIYTIKAKKGTTKTIKIEVI